jgi:predicted small secreted protein
MAMNKTLFVSLLAVCVLAAGCNTAKGVGQDVENTGENIKQTVDKND